MATLEPALGALIPTGWGKAGGLSFLYVGITFGGDNHNTSAGIVVITTKSNSNKKEMKFAVDVEMMAEKGLSRMGTCKASHSIFHILNILL